MKTKIDKSRGTNKSSTPFFTSKNDSGFFGGQPKLNIGQPNDKYEVEADRIADELVNNRQTESEPFFSPAQSQTVQAKHSTLLQEKSLAENITPLVQRQEEEEEAQPKLLDSTVQRQEEEEEEMLQTQPLDEEEEMLQAQPLEEEEGMLQAQEEEEMMQMHPENVQKQVEEEEEEPIQTQMDEEEILQTKQNGRAATSPSVESTLNNRSGNGNKMDAATRAEMEQGFGTDFGGVNIHTDSRAVQMSKQIGAQAFTHGNDVYFNKGKYSPSSKEGKHLLAHELTHTIQQNGTVQKKNVNNNISTTSHNVQGGFWGNVWSGIKSVGSAVWSGVKSVAGYGWNVLKSAGAWVWDLVTEGPLRIWRILKHIGSGIIGTLSWIWDAIKGGLGHLWSALKGVLSWLGGGVFGLFSWIWGGLKGGANWAWRLINGDFSGFWDGIGAFFSWLGQGVVGLAKWGWDGLKGVAIWAWQGVKGVAKWIWLGFLGGAAWVGRFITKVLDLVGFGEILDLVFNIIKVNTRTLNSIEDQEARKVFLNSISYWQVRIDEASLIALIGAFFSGGGGMGVTLFHTINFNKRINAAAGNGDMRWLIHELTHVSQYEHVGSQYIGEAIHAQATVGYAYGNGAGLVGKDLKDFNREQQADIIAHYYYYILSGNADTRFSGFAADYNRMVTQARNGAF